MDVSPEYNGQSRSRPQLDRDEIAFPLLVNLIPKNLTLSIPQNTKYYHYIFNRLQELKLASCMDDSTGIRHTNSSQGLINGTLSSKSLSNTDLNCNAFSIVQCLTGSSITQTRGLETFLSTSIPLDLCPRTALSSFLPLRWAKSAVRCSFRFSGDSDRNLAKRDVLARTEATIVFSFDVMEGLVLHAAGCTKLSWSSRYCVQVSFVSPIAKIFVFSIVYDS